MALNAYLSLKGQKTGDIKGSVVQKGREGKIAVNAVSHEVISPRDSASGAASGKRQHKPIVITKEIDKSTPLLMNALVSNETITQWELQFWRPSSGGTEQQYYTIKLTNANIASIAMHMPNNTHPELARLETYEEISFTYQKIEWTWKDGGITAVDDWMTGII